MTSAVDNYEESVRAAQRARLVIPDLVVLPHAAMCQLEAYVYMKAADLDHLTRYAQQGRNLAEILTRIRISEDNRILGRDGAMRLMRCA